MWTIIILTVIFIFGGIMVSIKEGDWLALIFMPLIGATIGILVALIFSLFIKTTTVLDKTYNLESLQDNSSVNGSFFLGCGTINGSMMYVYYYNVEGGYKMGKVGFNETTIRYSESNPKIEFYKDEPSTWLGRNFTVGRCDCVDNYIIYVPKGTIRQNYTLDAQ